MPPYGGKTGKQTLRNTALVQAVQDSLVVGSSLANTAAELHVSPQTVALIRDTVATEPNRLVSFKDGMLRSVERVMAKALNRYEEALDNDELKPATLPLGFGIMGTKRLELLSEVSTGIAPSPGLDPHQLIADLSESVPACIPLSTTEHVETEQDNP